MQAIGSLGLRFEGFTFPRTRLSQQKPCGDCPQRFQAHRFGVGSTFGQLGELPDATGDKDHLLHPAFNRLQQEVGNGNAIGSHHHRGDIFEFVSKDL